MILGVTGDPMMTVVLLTAKDNGSMLRDDYLSEVERLTNYLMSNHTVMYNNELVSYENFCSPYCSMNIAIRLFKVSAGKYINQSLLTTGASLAAKWEWDFLSRFFPNFFCWKKLLSNFFEFHITLFWSASLRQILSARCRRRKGSCGT